MKLRLLRARGRRHLFSRHRVTPSTVESLESRIVLSPLTWTAGADLPAPRGGAAAVMWGDTVLVLGGGTMTVNALYANSNYWRSAVPLDVGRSFLGVANIGSSYLVYGGSSGHTPLDAALTYSPTSADQTQDAATMSTPRAHLGYAGDGTHAYAIGGLNEQNAPLASVERYSPADDSWAAIAPLPQALSGLSAVSDGTGHLYTFGGAAAGGTPTTAVYRYTISTNKWDALPAMPEAEHDGTAVLGANGKVYVIGGISSAGTIDTVQTYDLGTEKWATETPLPYAVSSAAAVADADGHVIVIGGFDAHGAALATVSVSQKLNAPDQVPVFTSSLPGTTSVILGNSLTYYAAADGNPQPTFSLVSGPHGLTIDSNSGLVTFTPAPSNLGAQTAVIRASNFAGQTDQKFSFQVALPAPTGVTARATGPNSIAFSWTAPADAPPDSYYRVYERHFIHNPRGSGGSYVYTLLGDHIPTTAVTISGFKPGTFHTFEVQATTPSGGTSPKSAPAGAQTYTAPTYFAELLLLAQNYGHAGGFSQGDLNLDGKVDFADLLVLAQNYR